MKLELSVAEPELRNAVQDIVGLDSGAGVRALMVGGSVRDIWSASRRMPTARWTSCSCHRSAPTEPLRSKRRKKGSKALGFVCCAALAIGVAGCDKTDAGRDVTKTESPMRGRLFDCKGQLLAKNSTAFEYHQSRSDLKSACDVVLTIDRGVQAALQDVLDKYADTNDTGRAWGVVMEAKTGAIRAIADTCSASEFTNGVGSVYSSWFAYEPGSVLKPITAAIAIDRGIAKIDTPYSTKRDDDRYYKLPGDGGHAWPETMTVGDALVKSSNIVMGKLSYDVGQERMYLGLASFGFGRKPESGCVPENAGVLQDCRKCPWDKVVQSRVGVGQAVAVTALQLARAYAILANGGMDVRPYTVEKIVEQDGTVKFWRAPEATNRVVSCEAASAVCKALERVPSVEGTARRAAVEGVRVAGKTGTAQIAVGGRYAYDRFRATFAGFFPAEDPKYVIVTTFETKKIKGRQMHQGGQRPALAFAEIVRELKGEKEAVKMRK